MKWVVIFVITGVMIVMTLFEWPKIKPNQKKEKMAFVALAAIAWALAVLLLLYPEIPGPTEAIDRIYKPLGKLMEK